MELGKAIFALLGKCGFFGVFIVRQHIRETQPCIGGITSPTLSISIYYTYKPDVLARSPHEGNFLPNTQTGHPLNPSSSRISVDEIIGHVGDRPLRRKMRCRLDLRWLIRAIQASRIRTASFFEPVRNAGPTHGKNDKCDNRRNYPCDGRTQSTPEVINSSAPTAIRH